MTSILSRAALMAGVITLAGVTAASPQTHPAPPADGAPRVERRVVVMGGPGGMHHPGGPGMMGGGHKMDPAKHAEHLRAVLQLRPDQEGALKAFIASMTPPERPAPAAGAPPHHPDMPKTTPERLAMAEKMMAEHQAMFKKHNDALRAFYAQLTPSQQKAFDALHMGMGRHHRGGPGMGRRMRMMHPGGPGGAGMEGGPGGGMFIIGGPDDEQEFEIELDDGGDDSDQ